MNRQPPVGKNKPFIVQCDGKDIAGFDSRKEADDACEMYAKPQKGGKPTTRRWEVVARKAG